MNGGRVARIVGLGVLGLSLLLAGPRAAWAEELVPVPTMDEARDVTTRHLKITVGGQPAGGVTLRVGRLPDGRRLTESRSAITVTLRNGPEKESIRKEERQRDLHSAGDRRLLATTSVTSEGGVETREQTAYRDGWVEYLVEGPEGTFRGRIEVPPDHADDLTVFDELKAAWKEGRTGHRAYRVLDLDDRRFEKNELWLDGKTSHEHAGRKHPAWKVRLKTDEADAEMVVDDDQLPYELTVMGGVVHGTWVDEPTLEVEDDGWSMTSYLPVDRAVPDMLKLDALELRVVVEPPPTADEEAPFLDNEYQTVERLPEGYRLVLHHRRPPVDFAPAAFPVETDDPAVRRYLAPTPKSQCDHPDVVALAASVTEGARDSFAAARRIVHWVWANVEKRSGTRGAASAVEVLASGRGDCTEHAVLTVALCRAAGIPARSIGGIEYLVGQDGTPLAGYHAWAEAWVGRWVPLDATIPQVGTSARYILLAVDEPGEKDSRAHVALVLSKKLRLEVLAWKHLGRDRVEIEAAPAAR